MLAPPASALATHFSFKKLALSLKFLSIADQAYHWSILDRETEKIITETF